MQPEDLDHINRDELFKLTSEIKIFVDSLNFSERAYTEGWGEYDDLRRDAAQDFQKLRSRIRGLAIEWGIHADFLREYTEVERQYKLKVSAEKWLALKQESATTGSLWPHSSFNR